MEVNWELLSCLLDQSWGFLESNLYLKEKIKKKRGQTNNKKSM